MARPGRKTVDYFLHSVKHGKTMFVLESKYQNDGYALLFKLFERLGETEGHFINLKDETEVEYVLTKAHLTRDKCFEIIGLLVKLETFDRELWEQHLILWSDHFVNGIAAVYAKRHTETPIKPSFREENPGIASVVGEKTPTMPQQYKGSKENINTNTCDCDTVKPENDDLDSEAEKIYQLYPYRDGSNNSRSTGKSSKCKLKIKSILKTGYPLAEAIKKYLDECKTKKVYLKNFSTFLNNLPDTQEPEPKNPEPIKPVIEQNPWAKIRREAQQEAANATE